MKSVANGDSSPIMTLRDLSAYLRIHPSTIYRMCADGALPYFRLGADYRFDRGTIDRWIKKQTVNAR